MSAMIIDLMYISTSSAEEPDIENTHENLPEEEPMHEIDLRNVLAEYRKLYLMNRDMVGFVRIPGTLIEYPLMQHKDNDYYNHHLQQRHTFFIKVFLHKLTSHYKFGKVRKRKCKHGVNIS